MNPPTASSHQEILDRLREGNRRFAEGTANRFAAEEAELRRQLAQGQAPDAVILTCADSRVPPTLVFDQGLGDLFIIRVAGNVVSPEELGSVEFAVDQLGCRIVMVMGHTRCGAVSAAVDLLGQSDAGLSPNLRSITDRIRPAAEGALAEVLGPDALQTDALDGETRDRVIAAAIRQNVRMAAQALRDGSPLLDELAASGALAILGAEYCLESGTVEVLGEYPPAAD